MKLIPAGVSRKTGKPYPEFWACSNNQCKWIWRPVSKTDKQHQELLNALREIYKKIDTLEKNFKAFADIFLKVEEKKEKEE
jgi:hypothetical protein